ncbi:MAG: hypothetical protein J6E31_02860 [Pyramidobacter sp.]|nr:hypothetical protein [Pyramidobacter sp.]
MKRFFKAEKVFFAADQVKRPQVEVFEHSDRNAAKRGRPAFDVPIFVGPRLPVFVHFDQAPELNEFCFGLFETFFVLSARGHMFLQDFAFFVFLL